MEIYKGFFDLCVPYNENHKEFNETLKELFECGYRTIAVEQTFDYSQEKKKSSDLFPVPVNLDGIRKDFENKLKILNRLTIFYSDVSVTHSMNNSLNLKKYHIIAGAPKNETALQHCCATFNGDIITPDLEEKIVVIGHKHYQVATRRGICFELKYVPAIIDSNKRKDLITLSHNYALHRKAKKIIISSGAENRFHVRGPYDIANLGLIFGLSEEQAKSSISHLCRSVLLRAEGRRYGKTVMFVRNRPVVLTNSSDDSDDDDDDDDDEDDEEMEDVEERPPKKKRME